MRRYGVKSMIYGVDYYPEHWDKTEWEGQIALMKKARGIAPISEK